MKKHQILLTQKRLKELLDYAPGTGVFTRKITINSRAQVDDVAGHVDISGYRTIRISKARYSAHRLAWFYVHGEWPDNEIDHINGIKDDNRIINLRDVTSAENKKNKKLSIRNTSGVVGVSWDESNKKWMASICKDYKNIYLGIFVEKWDAICARRHAEYKYGFHPNHGRTLC